MASERFAEPKIPEVPIRTVDQMGLKELERIRLILRGGSVIEWRRLHFQTREEVDRFLKLCCLDPADPNDDEWIRTVLADSVEYLRREFDYRVSDKVAKPDEVHDLFLYASGAKEPKKLRRIACVVLKVMHVIQHIEGRALLFRLPVSEAEFQDLITAKVASVAQEAKEKGLQIVAFDSSIKTRESIITKLIAKKESVAAQVYDRTRFRAITRSPADILPTLYFLTQRLFPFNFVVPTQTQNTLVNFKALLQDYPHFEQYADLLHLDLDYEARENKNKNEFSGASYRVLNFVVDIPVRMDAFLPEPQHDVRPRKNRIAFGLVEFQIVDEATAHLNEIGENSHARYKQRQKEQVLRRLSRGLVVPKKKKKS
ncbi:MAG: TIGR04552 family protein [Myxococcaceae bacterium]